MLILRIHTFIAKPLDPRIFDIQGTIGLQNRENYRGRQNAIANFHKRMVEESVEVSNARKEVKHSNLCA